MRHNAIMRAIANGVYAPPQIGGVEIGAPGTGIYSGYALSWGDDFNELNVLAPANPTGRWWTTRTYLAGSRGSDTLLGTMYDTDPYMTGHNDSNRGAPVGYSNMRAADSLLTLQARKATGGEQVHMSSVRNEVGSMISGPGAVNWFPGAQATQDIVYEARMRFSAAAGNPAGWHPTLWLQSLNPTLAVDSDEIDWEGNSQNTELRSNIWTGGSVTGGGYGALYAHDGNFHVVSFVINTTQVRLYIDSVLYATGTFNGNTKLKPQYPLITSHIYSGTFNGDTYSQAAWNADANGAEIAVDWVRVWRRLGQPHYQPLAAVGSVNVDYGASASIVIPSTLTLWGDSGVTEYLQAVYNEENEPGVTHSTIYSQFPAGVSYNSGTRTLTANITSGKTGRVNFVMSAWKAGATCEPLRFCVNVGPNVTVSTLNLTAGQSVSYDLYAACDCGVLTTNGTSKAKTISVSGLSGSGLSYSDSTGLLTGTAVAGSFPLSVTVTNSVGQSKTASVTLTTAAAYAYEGWTTGGVGWFDVGDATARTTSGASVTGLTNKRTGAGDLTGAGDARTLVTAGQNGRDYVSLTRNTASVARFQSGTTSTLSQAFQGNDKPYTVLMVYRPTDTNTGFMWSASAFVDATNSEQIALIRRSASAPSIRRQLVTATTLDVSWGAGQAANAWRIVAVKHSGTAVSVWDTSTTASVSASAQDAAAFSTNLIFYVGAAQTNGSVGSIAPTTCAMDFAEVVVQSTARTDAEIQQAVTDLAAKWGVALL